MLSNSAKIEMVIMVISEEKMAKNTVSKNNKN